MEKYFYEKSLTNEEKYPFFTKKLKKTVDLLLT